MLENVQGIGSLHCDECGGVAFIFDVDVKTGSAVVECFHGGETVACIGHNQPVGLPQAIDHEVIDDSTCFVEKQRVLGLTNVQS